MIVIRWVVSQVNCGARSPEDEHRVRFSERCIEASDNKDQTYSYVTFLHVPI